MASRTASRLLASSSRLASTSSSTPIIYRSFSCSSPFFQPSSSLPGTLPHHTHPNSLAPTPFPTTTSSPTPLELLSSQPSHYISVLLLGRRYLLTENDILTVPKLKGISPGSKIGLTRILEVGSRDYTLRATSTSSPSTFSSPSEGEEILSSQNQPTLTPLLTLSTRAATPSIPRDFQRYPDSLPYLPASTVSCTATVVEHTKGAMFEVEKFKKRKGYRRLLRFKLGFTKIRIGKIVIGGEEAGETAVQVEGM